MADDPRSLTEIAETYEKIWEANLYSGFSLGTTGEKSTPFLVELIKYLSSSQNGVPTRVFEAGAGSGSHSRALAGLDGYHVIAVDSSDTAYRTMIAGVAQAKLGKGSTLEIKQGNFLEVLGKMPGDFIKAFYASAVFHFLEKSVRENAYALLNKKGIPLVGVTYKAAGDALESIGKLVYETEAGKVIRGNDGIQRLFVADHYAIVNEMGRGGYNTRMVVDFEVPGYNIKGEPGKFFGFLAERG